MVDLSKERSRLFGSQSFKYRYAICSGPETKLCMTHCDRLDYQG
jgi:hypothetical protein